MNNFNDGIKFVCDLIDMGIVVCPVCKQVITKNHVRNNEVLVYGQNAGSKSKQQETLIFHNTESCSTVIMDTGKYFNNVDIIKYAYTP